MPARLHLGVQYQANHNKIHSLTHTHLYTDTKISRQFEVRCLTQGHIDMWQEEAGIEPTTLQDEPLISVITGKPMQSPSLKSVAGMFQSCVSEELFLIVF
ncbi:hypothetical protein GOODEAATRI_034069 [Goodea atripinnis]|uniref:Uncharacterized protein n=1 Tax=Goodea atripinnis TaxID=208336 RepID=A0ABV0N6N8_9TELE